MIVHSCVGHCSLLESFALTCRLPARCLRTDAVGVVRFQCFRDGRERVRWRLLGSNNRVLGISLRTAPDHLSALAEVDTVRRYAHETDFHLIRLDSGSWSWRMTFPASTSTSGSAPVATSSRTFPRQVDARLAAERFKLRVAEADVDRLLVVFHPGRRGRAVRLSGNQADVDD
jgi:hypothetical protein